MIGAQLVPEVFLVVRDRFLNWRDILETVPLDGTAFSGWRFFQALRPRLRSYRPSGTISPQTLASIRMPLNTATVPERQPDRSLARGTHPTVRLRVIPVGDRLGLGKD